MQPQAISSFRLGLFVIATLAILVAGVFWIGAKQFLLQPTYTLNTEFTNVAGLFGGSPVRVGGLVRGSVKQIQLPNRPDGKVKVIMTLVTSTKAVIRKDSTALINSEGLIGDLFVEITFGSPDAPEVEDGAFIASVPPLQISDLVKKANNLLDTANGAMTNIEQTAAALSSIGNKIDRGAGTAGALVNDKSLYSNLNSGVAAMHEDMEALKKNFLLRGFFKNRGYEDTTELKKNLVSEIPTAAPTKTFTYDGEKLFDKPTTAKLKRGKLMNEAGQYLERTPYGLVIVASFSDMRGDSEKEATLSEARSMVARDYLVQNFKLDDTKIKTIGMGKSPRIDKGSEIQVIIYPPSVAVPTAKTTKGKK